MEIEINVPDGYSCEPCDGEVIVETNYRTDTVDVDVTNEDIADFVFNNLNIKKEQYETVVAVVEFLRNKYFLNEEELDYSDDDDFIEIVTENHKEEEVERALQEE